MVVAKMHQINYLAFGSKAISCTAVSGCVNLRLGYPLAALSWRPALTREAVGAALHQTNQPFQGTLKMKKLLAAMIAGLFAIAGAAIAQEKKAEAKKEEAKKTEAKKEEKKDAPKK
jgi:hypothetical protein